MYSHGVLGLIVNVADPRHDRLEERTQVPCFYVDEPSTLFPGKTYSVPVYEVWFWHRALKRWFVMSTQGDPAMQAQGVVYFRPNDTTALRRSITDLRVVR